MRRLSDVMKMRSNGRLTPRRSQCDRANPTIDEVCHQSAQPLRHLTVVHRDAFVEQCHLVRVWAAIINAMPAEYS
jgi:hypothetical protein